VIELLDAGIDVYTTVNVQHVESLNDVVAKITGVVMRETIPDSVFERADEVELIDLPPDDLLQRFREGKVYLPGQAQEAIGNFFRKGNLIALRELALRATAQRVDAQMRVYRREHAIDKVWPTTERVLVCIGATPYSTRLVRAAKRMADSLGAEWIAAYGGDARAPRAAAGGARRRRADAAPGRAARRPDDHAERRHHERDDPGPRRDRNVTKIVVGKPRRTRLQRFILGSIVDALVQGSGDIDVYVISAAREDGTAPPPIRRRMLPTDWLAYAQAAAVVAIATGMSWLLSPVSGLSNLVMVYLLGIVVVAMRTGRGPSLAAAVLSVAAFDFFFVPPYFTFAVTDVRYLFTFAVMLIVGLVISSLTVRTRTQAEAAQHREAADGRPLRDESRAGQHARHRRAAADRRAPRGGGVPHDRRRAGP